MLWSQTKNISIHISTIWRICDEKPPKYCTLMLTEIISYENGFKQMLLYTHVHDVSLYILSLARACFFAFLHIVSVEACVLCYMQCRQILCHPKIFNENTCIQFFVLNYIRCNVWFYFFLWFGILFQSLSFELVLTTTGSYCLVTIICSCLYTIFICTFISFIAFYQFHMCACDICNILYRRLVFVRSYLTGNALAYKNQSNILELN